MVIQIAIPSFSRNFIFAIAENSLKLALVFNLSELTPKDLLFHCFFFLAYVMENSSGKFLFKS